MIGIMRVLLGLLFATCGFVTWQSQLSLVDQLDVRHCDVGDRHDGVGRVDDHCGTRSDRRHQQELFAYVLSFLIYMFSYVPISFQYDVRQVGMEANRA